MKPFSIRPQTDRKSLFTTTKGRLNYNYARNMVKSIAMKSGVPKFHAHAARHWCATTLLKRDSHGERLDIREVQSIWGVGPFHGRRSILT